MKYVQIARRLRFQRGPGKEDLVSERPVKLNAEGEVAAYLDDPIEDPTFVDITDELLGVDIPMLERSGAIRSIPPPAPLRSAGRKAEESDG